MADAERIIRGCVPSAEARSAERSLHHRTGLHQRRAAAVFHQLHINRHGSGVYTQSKSIRADIFPLQDIRRRADILKSAARAARDDPLVHHELAVLYLILQMILHCTIQAHQSPLLRLVQNIHQIRVKLLDGISIAGMERHRDHRAHLVQVNLDHTVIICHLAGIQLRIVLAAPMDLIKLLDLLIRLPDGGQAGRLRGHHVNADTEIRGQGGYPGTYELHHLIFHKSILEHRPNDSQRHILRPHTLDRRAF